MKKKNMKIDWENEAYVEKTCTSTWTSPGHCRVLGQAWARGKHFYVPEKPMPTMATRKAIELNEINIIAFVPKSQWKTYMYVFWGNACKQ